MATGTLILGAGCIQAGTARYRLDVPESLGSISDVNAAPGRHDGYEVLGLCERYARLARIFVVRGTGSRRIAASGETFGKDPEDGWSDEMVALRARVEKALAPVASVVWYARGGCYQTGFTLDVGVTSYKDVDAAIARVGAMLRDEGLADEVDVGLALANEYGPRRIERSLRMPLARRPFFPYEASLAAGARHRGESWDPTVGLHLGLIWGREAQHPSKAGWFWGPGIDARFSSEAGEARWSAGPSLRAGRAFGALAPDRPGPSANRGTYVFAQVGARWSAEAPVVASSLGLTTLALGELILTRHNTSGRYAYLLLLPLALLNHVQLDWELATSGDNRSRVALLLGFSL